MDAGIVSIAVGNLSSPVILFFLLGLGAALARSDLSIPEALAKGLALYLMLAIGFKGGVELSKHGLEGRVFWALLAGALLSFLIPFLAFWLLRRLVGLNQVNAAAVSAHYGSVSVVTFVTALQFLERLAVGFEGYMVAVVAVMETPAILTGLLLAKAAGRSRAPIGQGFGINKQLLREVLLNGSVVLLMGAFVVGWITGEDGMTRLSPFVVTIFEGVLALFLLDMGLLAGSRLRASRLLTVALVAFGVIMPLISAVLGLVAGALVGLSLGGTMLLGVLAASASYIAVPAAMRLALPSADPGLYLTLSLAVTFPFNVIVGIPLYFFAAGLLVGS